MSEVEPESRIEVTFHPQKWVDSPGKDHEWGQKQLIPTEEREPVSFSIPWADGTDSAGSVFEDESYEANRLQNHKDAPEWVNGWDGPYFVTTASK